MVKFACAFSWLIRGLIVAAFSSTVFAGAEQAGFTSTLSAENKTASGIVRLTEPQVAALDQQVQRELTSARQGKTVAFASTFTHRRSPLQRTEAGLDTLTTPELAQLDRLVAAALANLPPPNGPTVTAPASTALSPSAYVEILPRKMEIHGEVTLAYVWGSGGGHGYGTSMVTTATDPSGKYSLTVGISQFTGKGFHHFYDPYDCECDRGW